MAYPLLVRQDGFQLPSPANTASPKSTNDDDRDDQLFMPHNISSFLPDPFRKFPHQTHPNHHPQPIEFTDELANLIETPHLSSHERSTNSRSPNDDTYRHNIFDIPASNPAQQHHHDIYQPDYAHFNSTLPALNSSIRYEPHPDPSAPFHYPHSPSPTHRSRSRSRAPSVGPTRSARRDRRANSISSHVSSTSSPPPPRPHPHAIVIPGRGNSMGGFFVPNGTSAPPDYSLPTPDSLSHSFALQHAQTHSQHPQFPYAAQSPSSPYYAYSSLNRTETPSLGISPTDVETLNSMSMGGMTAHHLPSSVPAASHVGSIPKPTPPTAPAPAQTTKSLDPEVHLSEKRRRRRESHNAVERRRRDNINERISDLAGLIPGVLFECDGPLVVPGTNSPVGAAPGSNLAEDLFTIGILSDPGMHVLSVEDGLPNLPEEGSMVKKDPCEEGEVLAPTSPTSASALNGAASGAAANGNLNEQMTIKANKGMILRKSVEYIRYLQQLVSAQASRGRDLEERNRALERELAALRGEVPSTSTSPSMASSAVLSMTSSSVTSESSKPSSVAESLRGMECGEGAEDLEMDDASGASETGEYSREGDDCASELRGRQLARARDKMQTHGLVLREEDMES